MTSHVWTSPVQQSSRTNGSVDALHDIGEQQMETIKLARARTLAGLAAMLLGSAGWSGTVSAQTVASPTANPTTSAAVAKPNTTAATPDTNAAATNAAGAGQTNNDSAASARAPTDPGVRGGDP